MGSRSVAEGLIRIILAFQEKPRWIQSELAVKIDLTVENLQIRLNQFNELGMRFEKRSGANMAEWTMEKGLFPEGVVFQGEGLWDLLCAVASAPPSEGRTSALSRILRVKAVGAKANTAVAVGRDAPVKFLGEITSAALARNPLCIQYRRSDGVVVDREISVHFTTGIGNLRFLATDHNDQHLKWFRIGRVQKVSEATAVGFRDRPEPEVIAFEQESAFGYHGTDKPQRISFVATDETWRIIEDNMPAPPVKASAVKGGGTRVTVRTTAVGVWARYLIGYIRGITPESPALRDEMRMIVDAGVRALASPVGTAPAALEQPQGVAVQLVGVVAKGQGVESPAREKSIAKTKKRKVAPPSASGGKALAAKVRMGPTRVRNARG